MLLFPARCEGMAGLRRLGWGPKLNPLLGAAQSCVQDRVEASQGLGTGKKIRASVSLAHMELCRERAVLACMREHRVVGEEISH